MALGDSACMFSQCLFLALFPCVLTQTQGGIEHNHDHEADRSKGVPVKMKQLVQTLVHSRIPVRCHYIWGDLARKAKVDLTDFPATKKNRLRVGELAPGATHI